jgi:hypothetical protein
MANDTGALCRRLRFALDDRDWKRAKELIEKMKGDEDDGNFVNGNLPVPVGCYSILLARLQREQVGAKTSFAQTREQLNQKVQKWPGKTRIPGPPSRTMARSHSQRSGMENAAAIEGIRFFTMPPGGRTDLTPNSMLRPLTRSPGSLVLWVMLTGHSVFRGSPAEIMYQHQHAPLPLERLKDFPQPVEVLLEKLLEKDPAQRFQTPDELLKAIPKITDAIDARRAWEKGERLAKLIAHRRTLLVLDGLEPSKTRQVRRKKDVYVSLPAN